MWVQKTIKYLALRSFQNCVCVNRKIENSISSNSGKYFPQIISFSYAAWWRKIFSACMSWINPRPSPILCLHRWFEQWVWKSTLRLWPLYSSLIFAVNHWLSHQDIYHSAMLPMLVFDIVIPHGLLFTYASCKKKIKARYVNKHYILKAKGQRFNSTIYITRCGDHAYVISLGCTDMSTSVSCWYRKRNILSWTTTVSYFFSLS